VLTTEHLKSGASVSRSRLMEPSVEHAAAAAAIRREVGAKGGQLLAMVRRHCGPNLDPDDVLQRAFERALERSDQLRDLSRADAWLGRVVRNVLVDELRRRTARTVEVDGLEIPASDDDPIDCWCVLAQADQLKPEYATILRRVVVDGVPVTQVATELGLTANNAMVRLHRARTALRERLADHCGTTTARACSDCGCAERGCCERQS
jgi:DNA-directed RNA polymerase specialized sigma24 family protein